MTSTTDNASKSKSPSPSQNEHLSFPALPDEQPSVVPQVSRQVLKDRLYIGNLHPSVDEYSLLQLFSKFGKVTKLDFLFHKTGALKGKPRGYAFIEYGSNHEALKALSMAHDKLIRGRKLVVTFAHQAPIDQAGSGTSKRKGMMETGRPTTLSMLKAGPGGRHDATGNKIAMMEAKLRQMESTNPKPTPSSESTPAASTSKLVPIAHHPSLPAKPPPSLPADLVSGLPLSHSYSRPTPRTKPSPLPSLPIPPSSLSQPVSQSSARETKSTALRQQKSSKLAGVKIGKPKDKKVPPEEASHREVETQVLHTHGNCTSDITEGGVC